MNSSVPTTHTSAFYTVRETAWLLGVNPSKVCQKIRTGALPAIRRRSRLVVPAYALALLLDEPAGASPPSASNQRTGGESR